MPRRPRIEAAGAFHHVVAQGNGGAQIVRDDVDRVSLIRRLASSIGAFGWRCHAYCVLDTHLHLVVETPEPNLGRGIGQLTGGHAHAFNGRHGLDGHLFRRPYYSRPVDRESHLVSACVYVVLNPVRAGLCDHPADWRWCSYRETAFGDLGIVDGETLLASFGADLQTARLHYRRAVEQAVAELRSRQG